MYETIPQVVDPYSVYSKKELMRRLQWTDGTLQSARRAGLRCRYFGRQLFFMGRDVIEFLDKHARDER